MSTSERSGSTGRREIFGAAVLSLLGRLPRSRCVAGPLGRPVRTHPLDRAGHGPFRTRRAPGPGRRALGADRVRALTDRPTDRRRRRAARRASIEPPRGCPVPTMRRETWWRSFIGWQVSARGTHRRRRAQGHDLPRTDPDHRRRGADRVRVRLRPSRTGEPPVGGSIRRVRGSPRSAGLLTISIGCVGRCGCSGRPAFERRTSRTRRWRRAPHSPGAYLHGSPLPVELELPLRIRAVTVCSFSRAQSCRECEIRW